MHHLNITCEASASEGALRKTLGRSHVTPQSTCGTHIRPWILDKNENIKMWKENMWFMTTALTHQGSLNSPQNALSDNSQRMFSLHLNSHAMFQGVDTYSYQHINPYSTLSLLQNNFSEWFIQNICKRNWGKKGTLFPFFQQIDYNLIEKEVS